MSRLEARIISLGELDSCIYCGRGERPKDPAGTPLTTDHIISAQAGADHPILLRQPFQIRGGDILPDLTESLLNLRRTCRPCHDQLDCGQDGKNLVYAREGLPGMIRHVAYDERLPLDENTLRHYLMQRSLLFRHLQSRLIGTLMTSQAELSSAQINDYDLTATIVNQAVNQWDQGQIMYAPFIPNLNRFRTEYDDHPPFFVTIAD